VSQLLIMSHLRYIAVLSLLFTIIIIIIYFAQQHKTAVTNINSQRAGQ